MFLQQIHGWQRTKRPPHSPGADAAEFDGYDGEPAGVGKHWRDWPGHLAAGWVLILIGATGILRCTSRPRPLLSPARGVTDRICRLIRAARTSIVERKHSNGDRRSPPCCCRAARFCSWADKRCGRLTMARPSSGRIPRPCLSTILRRTASRRSGRSRPRMASIHGNRAFFCFRTAKCS